jgi:hypothetical protein
MPNRDYIAEARDSKGQWSKADEKTVLNSSLSTKTVAELKAEAALDGTAKATAAQKAKARAFLKKKGYDPGLVKEIENS